jgi:hypothetical protein
MLRGYMADLRDAHHAIRRELSEIYHLWNEVRGQWRDETAIRFEKEHWQPGVQIIDDYLRGLGKMIDVLERAEHEIGSL